MCELVHDFNLTFGEIAEVRVFIGGHWMRQMRVHSSTRVMRFPVLNKLAIGPAALRVLAIGEHNEPVATAPVANTVVIVIMNVVVLIIVLTTVAAS